MNSDSDSNEHRDATGNPRNPYPEVPGRFPPPRSPVEPVVKEEKPIPSKSSMEFHHKKFNSIPEANFANNPNSNEFPEGGQETSEKHNVTGQQYIKQEKLENPNAILDNPNAILDNPNAILDNPNAKQEMDYPNPILDNSRFYRSWNPWAVSSIFEFNYFCCPECDFSTRSDFKTESIQEFINHAISHHPWVSYRVKRIKSCNMYTTTH